MKHLPYEMLVPEWSPSGPRPGPETKIEAPPIRNAGPRVGRDWAPKKEAREQGRKVPMEQGIKGARRG